MISLFAAVGSWATACNGKSFQKEKRSNFLPCFFSNSTDTKESFPHQNNTNNLSASKLILLF
jgi:hypothetical protein